MNSERVTVSLLRTGARKGSRGAGVTKFFRSRLATIGSIKEPASDGPVPAKRSSGSREPKPGMKPHWFF